MTILYRLACCAAIAALVFVMLMGAMDFMEEPYESPFLMGVIYINPL